MKTDSLKIGQKIKTLSGWMCEVVSIKNDHGIYTEPFRPFSRGGSFFTDRDLDWDWIKENNKHGGKRPGAGRKPKEPTTTMRVPVWLKAHIQDYINTMQSAKNLAKKK